MEDSDEMREAGERLLKLSTNEEAREIARAREDSQWAWEHTLHATKEQGREEGVQEGEYKKAIEMAISLLKSGMSTEKVAKHSKLSLENVEQLIEQI